MEVCAELAEVEREVRKRSMGTIVTDRFAAGGAGVDALVITECAFVRASPVLEEGGIGNFDHGSNAIARLTW